MLLQLTTTQNAVSALAAHIQREHTYQTPHIVVRTVADLPDGACTENLSLDGQGRVEDHWQQTELGGVTYLDTEPGRGEPLQNYLQKMVFWAAVQVAAPDLAVLSLIGPRVADPAVLAALGLSELPAESTAVAVPGGSAFVRRMPAADGQVEVDLVVARPASRLETVRLWQSAPYTRGYLVIECGCTQGVEEGEIFGPRTGGEVD